jgi:hypothetical protein
VASLSNKERCGLRAGATQTSDRVSTRGGAGLLSCSAGSLHGPQEAGDDGGVNNGGGIPGAYPSHRFEVLSPGKVLREMGLLCSEFPLEGPVETGYDNKTALSVTTRAGQVYDFEKQLYRTKRKGSLSGIGMQDAEDIFFFFYTVVLVAMRTHPRFVVLHFVGCKPGRTGHMTGMFLMFVIVSRDEC